MSMSCHKSLKFSDIIICYLLESFCSRMQNLKDTCRIPVMTEALLNHIFMYILVVNLIFYKQNIFKIKVIKNKYSTKRSYNYLKKKLFHR